METNKKNITVYQAPAAHMVGDGFRVHNFFPSGHKLKMSPFFLLDYNAKLEFSATNHKRGVGVHPHRGFETVTIAYHGAIAHHDSAGNSGTIHPGDVQWMTAGRGILHKEYHDQTFAQKGGLFQMVQLWVNLPAKHKMTAPKYQEIAHASIPKIDLDNNAGQIELIAGEINGVKGIASTFTPIDLYNVKLAKNGRTTLNFKPGYHTGFVVIEGELKLNGEVLATEDQFVYVDQIDSLEVEATTASIILVLSGEPINEPIAQYGPFLMNKPEEIQQAIADYNTGKFGHLDD